MEYITVETRASDVNCPDCGERMRKRDYPIRPWPSEIRNADSMTPYFGQAFCDSCGENLQLWRYLR